MGPLRLFCTKVNKTAGISERKHQLKVQKFAFSEKRFTNFPFPALGNSSVINFYAVRIFEKPSGAIFHFLLKHLVPEK